MKSLINVSIKRSVTVCVLVVVLLAAGVLATLNMSINLLPNIKLPMLGIAVVYPGAAAQSVEQGVTAKVEGALQSVPGITQLSTTSYDNVSVLVLTFDYGTDIDDKISAIKDAMQDVALPDGCAQPSYIKIDMNGTATATVALFGEEGDLSSEADALVAQLGGIEGVGSVTVLGTPERQIRITAMSGLEMTALLAVQALQTENLNIPLGTVMQDGTTVSVRNATDAASLLDVMRLPVELPLGSELFAALDMAKGMLLRLENCTLQEYTSLLDMLYTLHSVVTMSPNSTDEELAEALGNMQPQYKALVTPQLVHVVRSEDFYRRADLASPSGINNVADGCVLGRMLAVKRAHVDEDGNAVYSDGTLVVTNEQGRRTLTLGGQSLFVNSFGYAVDGENRAVGDNGLPVDLTEEQTAARYNTYGSYTVFSDEEAAELCTSLALGSSFGLGVTADIVRFVRICDFGGQPTTGEDGTESTVYPQSVVVPLAYIGRVEEISSQTSFAQYNGLAAATIEVYANADANTTDVVRGVKRVLAGFSGAGNALLLDDKAEFITDSISNVLVSIVIGGVLAVLVIYLFVRKVGSSLVVSITMPLSVLVALIGLWAMDITLNLVSLGGLAVGIGMLVDNSIVVLESITKRRDMGESVRDACLNGTSEVAGSLFASTLTNVCVFFPILFARGLTREIFYDLVWAVLFSIVMSLIVAVTVIPSLYNLIYRNGPRKRYRKGKNGQRVQVGSFEEQEPRPASNALFDESAAIGSASPAPIEKAEQTEQTPPVKKGKRKKRSPAAHISRLENGYGRILGVILTKRVWVCVVALVLFASSVALVFATGTEFLPSVDKGVIEVDVDFDTSTSIEQIQDTGKLIADTVRNHFGDKLVYVSLTVGKQGMLALSDSAVIRIQTDTKQLRTEETVQQIRLLLEETPGIVAKSVRVRQMDGVVAEVTGGMSGQTVTLLSSDPEQLRQAAAAVAQRLSNADPEHIVSVVNNSPQLTTECSFTFDRLKCEQLGVDYQQAVLLLRVGMSGYTAANLNVQGDSIAVNVRFADDATRDMDAVCSIAVGFGSSGAILLRDVLLPAEDGLLYTAKTVEAFVGKQDGKYITDIDLEVFGTDTGSAGKTVHRVVDEVLTYFDDVQYLDGGVTGYLNDAFNGLVVSLVAAFVLLYSVMACQFESLRKPFVVIMSIPFSFTGGFLALAITGMTLNVVSFVGLIMLMGVIVNGAIVMIDKINMLIAEGMAPQQAVIEGCKSRLRPILMTTLTTVLALVPLALGLGRGGELMQPMGIVVLGGLLLGTAVTLVLIPCFYCLINRIRFGGQKPKAESLPGAEAEPTDFAAEPTDFAAEQTEFPTEPVSEQPEQK